MRRSATSLGSLRETATVVRGRKDDSRLCDREVEAILAHHSAELQRKTLRLEMEPPTIYRPL